MIEKVRELVKNKAKDEDYKYHISVVVKYAKELAKIKKANIELVELSALLHDIGRLDGDDKDHEITGLAKAEKILTELGADKKTIEEVKHCIESHRGSKGVSPKTLTAQIIANADAMSHFEMVPVFFYWRRDSGTFEEALEWVKTKLERDWNTKLTFPEAKELIKEKYNSIKLILDS